MLQLHTLPDGSFDPERQKLHDQIVEHFLPLDMKPPVGRDPIMHIVGGGPAAGKSTLIRNGKVADGQPGVDYVNVAPDDIKDMLPDYVALKNAGDLGAAFFAHEESSVIGHKILLAAQARGLDIVLDGTGDGSVKGLKEKVDTARAKGYKVYGHYASNSYRNAIASSYYRLTTEGRLVDDKTLLKIHQGVSQIFPEAIKQGFFDKASLFDTNIRDQPPRPVLSYERGKDATIHDHDLWSDFLEKGKGYQGG
jgi:hypothetical protein